MAKIIDLHIHTNLSDGSLSPKEVIDVAFENGVSIIAIADHDTVDAYDDELYEYARKKNIRIISAVEISAKNDRAGVHILGYNIDVHNEELKQNLFLLRNARHDYLHGVASKLKEIGYIINVELLDKVDAVTKAHIALDVVNNNENSELLLKNFNKIPSMGEFIEEIMNEGCPAYVKKKSITPEEAANLIRNAGGKVILAHPVAYKYEDSFSDDDVLDLISQINADGIESNYIYIDRNNNKVDEIGKWNKIGNENNLIVTIGSDFHNKDGIHPEIGLINQKLKIDDQTIQEIIRNLDC